MQNIALSPTELGDMIETINGGQSGKAIYHDPNKGRAGCAPGLTRKCCCMVQVLLHDDCMTRLAQVDCLIYQLSLSKRMLCSEGTEGKSLSISPGTRGVKEVYLNLMHKVRGQPDKKVSVSLSAGEMVVFKRLSEVWAEVHTTIHVVIGSERIFQLACCAFECSS